MNTSKGANYENKKGSSIIRTDSQKPKEFKEHQRKYRAFSLDDSQRYHKTFDRLIERDNEIDRYNFFREDKHIIENESPLYISSYLKGILL